MKRQKLNPHCPVKGCKTKQPHVDDPIVKGLIHEFSSPEKLIFSVRAAIVELMTSIERDVTENRNFAWITRLRQPEELYIRAIYALFIANEEELPHIISGDTPNGLSALYAKVNEVVFENRGTLSVVQAGLNYGEFTAMDTLHSVAHVSFNALYIAIGSKHFPEYLQGLPEKYFTHLRKYCSYLEYIEGLFKAGRGKEDVLAALVNLHRPLSYWQKKNV